MLALALIVGGVLLRLIPHLPNFAPITATAMFGGAHLSKRWAILLPLAAMAISDYLLLYINPYKIDLSRVYPLPAMFHSTTFYVWGSFIISGLLGIWLKDHRNIKNPIMVSLLASLQFFIITNFGVWAGGMYSRGLDGLLESYIMGLPFFKWTLMGDLFYTTVFFGTYELSHSFSEKQQKVNILTNDLL